MIRFAHRLRAVTTRISSLNLLKTSTSTSRHSSVFNKSNGRSSQIRALRCWCAKRWKWTTGSHSRVKAPPYSTKEARTKSFSYLVASARSLWLPWPPLTLSHKKRKRATSKLKGQQFLVLSALREFLDSDLAFTRANSTTSLVALASTGL